MKSQERARDGEEELSPESKSGHLSTLGSLAWKPMSSPIT